MPNAKNAEYRTSAFGIRHSLLTTDSDGRYRINNVPPGTYNVIAWTEGLASEPKSVTIPAGGLAELDFAVR